MTRTDSREQISAAPTCTVLRSGTCTAARPHMCASCSGAIGKGERHSVQVIVLDGEFQVVRLHAFPCWNRPC